MKTQTIDLSDPRSRIAVALDVSTLDEITHWVTLLKDYVGYFKVGFELIHSVGGPQAVRAVKEAGGKVFYDCKLHDISETMKKTSVVIEEITNLGVDIFNIHASAGLKAMEWVRSVSKDSMVSAVTVLSSLSEDECKRIYNRDIRTQVMVFATDIITAKLPSLICAPTEAGMVKNILSKEIVIISPGIRPVWALANDQNPDRIMTPYKAIIAGSDILVIGRPILQPPAEIGDPITAVKLIIKEIEEALAA
jgi:orotidine-5'-phosphate decarboxylase